MKITDKIKARGGPHGDQASRADFTPRTPHERDPLAYAAVLKALG
jgi:hypothetical protein